MTVFCEDCTHATQRAQSSFKWLCAAYKKDPQETYVRRNEVNEPMYRCYEIQKKFKGDCPSFEKAKRIENGEAG